MNIKHDTLRPREKLVSISARALSDHELLQIIIGNGSSYADVRVLARSVLRVFRSNYSPNIEKLQTIKGIGLATATKLVAAHELGARLIKVQKSGIIMEKLILDLRELQSHGNLIVKCINLDNRGFIISSQQFSGVIATSNLSGQVVKTAIKDGADQIMVGICRAQEDVEIDSQLLTLCRQLFDLCRTFSIMLLECVVVEKNSHRSLL